MKDIPRGSAHGNTSSAYGLDKPVTFSIFPDRKAFSKLERKMTLREVAALVHKQQAPTKRDLPWLSGVRFGDNIAASPSGKCYRNDANALSAEAVLVDHDAEGMTIEEARDRLAAEDVTCLLFESASALPHKFRGVLPLSRSCRPDQLRGLVARINGILAGRLDPASFNISQGFYYGAVGGRVPVVHLIEGTRFLDEAHDLEVYACGPGGGSPERQPRGHRTAGEKTGLTPEQFANAVAAMPNDERFAARDRWLQIGAAIFHEADGEAWGLEAFDAWSRKHGSYDADETARTWDSLHGAMLRSTGATVLKYAFAAGWTDPRPRRDPADLFEDLPPLPPEAQPMDRAAAIRKAADERAQFGDVWNGAAHARRIEGSRLFDSASGHWLEWTSQHWAIMTAEAVVADTTLTSAALVEKMAKDFAANPSDRNQTLSRLAIKLHGNAPALGRMEQMARSEPGMSVFGPLEFDRDPLALTCTNGILDLRSGRLRPTTPADRVSKLAGTAFDPNAQAPRWEAFLERVLPDPGVRAFIRRAAGYSLTGSVDEEIFFLLYGTGANGKSVFCEVLERLLGELAGSFGGQLVTRGRDGNEAARSVARLPGLRLAFVNETAQGDTFDSQRVKELASRDRISARQLYKEEFDFAPSHKLWIRTNHLPGSLDAGDGFWRRCIPIPFTVQIPSAERVPDLSRRIIAEELSGVLNWALAGCLDWNGGGLRVPKAIEEERARYREETDLTGQWLAERTTSDPQARVRVGAAFADFVRFCVAQNVQAGSQPSFSRSMTSRGIERDPSRKEGRRFIGFRLREISEEDDLIG